MKLKHPNILVIFLAVCFILLLLANAQRENGFLEENHTKPLGTPQLTLNLSVDKDVYHSSEEMKLTTTIQTPSRIENATVRVYGVKDRRGNYRIKGERVVSVEPPETSETFEFRMPSCYGCAGVSPGEYEIAAEIIKDGKVIGNFSKTVILEG